MRHLVKGKKLNRTVPHRKATLQALSVALITERRITTTVAKAKELRRFVEPLITRAKSDTAHNRRKVFSRLQDKYAVEELFEEVGPKAKDRPGGYTRVLKLGFRSGDAAELAMIELVDYNDVPPETGKESKKRTRRAGKSKKSTESREADAAIESKKDDRSGQKEDVAEGTAKKKGEAKPKKSKKQDRTSAEEQSPKQDTAAEKTSEQDVAAGKSPDQDTADAKSADQDAADEKSPDPSAAKEKQESETPLRAESMTVSEAREHMEKMSVGEARKFVGDDDRVTLQRALEKKIKEEKE